MVIMFIRVVSRSGLIISQIFFYLKMDFGVDLEIGTTWHLKFGTQIDHGRY